MTRKSIKVQKKKFIKMEMNNKIIITLLIFILALDGCRPSNSNTVRDTVNANVVESNEGWKKAKDIDTSNRIALDLHFLNNPYRFKKSDVLLYLEEVMIYKGGFKDKLRVYVPKEFFGKRIMPGLQIYNGNNEYNFIQKSSLFLAAGDNFLYIIFCPDNGLTSGYYFFSQKEEIL